MKSTGDSFYDERASDHDIESEPCYHGNICREEAEKRLRLSGFVDGKFLIRRKRNDFVISHCFQATISHYLVKRDLSNNCFSIPGGQYFSTLNQLIAYYHKQKEGLPCVLTMPCVWSDQLQLECTLYSQQLKMSQSLNLSAIDGSSHQTRVPILSPSSTFAGNEVSWLGDNDCRGLWQHVELSPSNNKNHINQSLHTHYPWAQIGPHTSSINSTRPQNLCRLHQARYSSTLPQDSEDAFCSGIDLEPAQLEKNRSQQLSSATYHNRISWSRGRANTISDPTHSTNSDEKHIGSDDSIAEGNRLKKLRSALANQPRGNSTLPSRRHKSQPRHLTRSATCNGAESYLHPTMDSPISTLYISPIEAQTFNEFNQLYSHYQPAQIQTHESLKLPQDSLYNPHTVISHQLPGPPNNFFKSVQVNREVMSEEWNYMEQNIPHVTSSPEHSEESWTPKSCYNQSPQQLDGANEDDDEGSLMTSILSTLLKQDNSRVYIPGLSTSLDTCGQKTSPNSYASTTSGSVTQPSSVIGPHTLGPLDSNKNKFSASPVNSIKELSLNAVADRSPSPKQKDFQQPTSNSGQQIKRPHILENHDIFLYYQLGLGNFGVVMQGILRDPDGLERTVAIKILRTDQEAFSTTMEEWIQEAKIMSELDHPNIIKFIGVFNGPPLMLVSELAPVGQLNKYLHNHLDTPVEMLMNYALQVARGMEYLEEKNFVHRDLAARNVLLATERQARISDFGMSRMLQMNKDYYIAHSGGHWPVRWYAPQCIYKFKFSAKSDVWSFAVTVWEIFSYGDRPYGEMSSSEILEAIERGERLARPNLCTPDVYKLLLQCWEYREDQRPSFKEIRRAMDILYRVMSTDSRVPTTPTCPTKSDSPRIQTTGRSSITSPQDLP